MKDSTTAIFTSMTAALESRHFLATLGMDKEEMTAWIRRSHLRALADELQGCRDEDGRFLSPQVLAAAQPYLDCLRQEPPGGWLKCCYRRVLVRLFPGSCQGNRELEAAVGRGAQGDIYRQGCLIFMQLLRGLYHYERNVLPFDPKKDMPLIPAEEIARKGYIKEYLRLRMLATDDYIYEFMRIGIDITPFNTLGHVGGVHYVAVYAARQLARNGIPVDVALISGAAACHDIGKYGCKKNEEKRVPYLHYYYTGMCCRRLGLPAIGHIAANHSVWDLELENLSVESLLLIYADFRVKSSRNDKGKEIVHFYSLAEAFDVILGKLDNVDEAKRQRYQKVYAKLADFEAFMEEHGVVTELPADFAWQPADPPQPVHREKVLLEGNDVIDQLKYAAIDHNIRLMSIFRDESDFGNLIEAARSERLWKNVRTYIGIFEEYSTYMTEHQKLMTLKFLYELLSHREGDIRLQAAALMGRIIANFNDTYTKELPEGVSLPAKSVTNLSLFTTYLDRIICPDIRFTEQHKLWIGYCLSTFISAVLQRCAPSQCSRYTAIMGPYYERRNYSEEEYIILLKVLADMDRIYLDDGFMAAAAPFIETARESDSFNLRVAALNCARHVFADYSDDL